MAIVDLLKRKKKEPSKKPVLKEKKPIRLETGIKKRVVSKRKKKIPSIAWKVLLGPHITEKATDLSKNNQYIFKIGVRTNKIEVKRAIKEVFDVEAKAVRIINIPKKPKRLGRTRGWKKGYKKAIVTVKKGQKIEISSH